LINDLCRIVILLDMPVDQFLPLASIDAARPVFMIVMGDFLMVVAWRMARETRAGAHGFSSAGRFSSAWDTLF
jgi:hypothetical protein